MHYYCGIINKHLGVSYNGSTSVSKTADGSSILSTPAIVTETQSICVFYFAVIRVRLYMRN